jgi:hypothetical protein
MHRLILGLDDPAISADHKNGNGLDNRRKNLRVATHPQNMANRHRHRLSKSGFIGVHKVGPSLWVATVGRPIDGRNPIGWFRDPIEAAHARDQAARERYGTFAKLNFPL